MTASNDDIRRWIVRNYRTTVEATIAVADDVAVQSVEQPGQPSQTPRNPLQRALAQQGLPERYAELLRALRAEFGHADGPTIVPAPPYVVASSRGPTLRLPIGAGRLVIDLVVFAVVPGDPVSYRRRGDEPEKVVTVRRRGTNGGGR